MKTAMQDLIEEFIQELKNGENTFSVDEKYLLKWVITQAEYKLEKEKEQTVDFAFEVYQALCQKNEVPKNLISENNKAIVKHYERLFENKI